MSSLREAWLCVLQDADGVEETELITIERAGDGAPPVIELTNGGPDHVHSAVLLSTGGANLGFIALRSTWSGGIPS